ncbi:MAG: DUF3144 domain-containing protein [Betaproteobacteria bacterium]
MAEPVDDTFFKRADGFIDFANQQCLEHDRVLVCGSFMYASTRFSAWISAGGSMSKEALRAARSERIEYFMSQYKLMLEENIDDYIKNFDEFMKPPTT